MVCLQMHAGCNSIDKDEAMRLLNVPDIHRTGGIHGVFTLHKGQMKRRQPEQKAMPKRRPSAGPTVSVRTAVAMECVMPHHREIAKTNCVQAVEGSIAERSYLY